MRNLRERITPARWRKFHIRIYVLVVGLLLLCFALDGSRWNGVPILAALALILLDLAGSLLFFRCPACGGILWLYRSGHCHRCGEYIDLRREEPR